ncbi:Baeyer-Villiger monooxygenase [Psilocybe cubensis]|uniref:Baeyer-Villiger monooxygenase n=1 Tax=Psilocybe cubensis TaxID=181762 RepID=A0ACB8H942_PSICU|nr:Baeyer-Villiger monooxygenase [Psilocybe cubensis]KAH9483680.1 Baeyer-Villiger monooxygenase [Psilocybe cubensis]
MAPKEEVKNLIPNYGMFRVSFCFSLTVPLTCVCAFAAPGCKRIIVDPGYLSALKQPNVNIRWDAIDRIVEKGIQMKSGEFVPLDVIIFSTGYLTDGSNQLQIRGRDGVTLREYFESKGGPYAYLGSCIPGFPNQYLVLGPNVASGHASVIFSEEAQIQHALQLIKPVLEGKAKSFEVTEEATVKYNEWLQTRLQDSVWTDCMSYYQAGRNNKTRIVATFPGPVALFWWFCRRPRWELFRGVGAEAWEQEQKVGRITKGALLAVVVAAALGIGFAGWTGI